MEVRIVDGKVSTSGFTNRPIGPPAGARTDISDLARHRRVMGAVTTPVLPR
jgi:hypothetical protein